MRRAALVLLLVLAAALGFAQIPGGGVQLGGVLSANLIDDFLTNTAYSDSNNGFTYLQLNESFKDGPFGLECRRPLDVRPRQLLVNHGVARGDPRCLQGAFHWSSCCPFLSRETAPST